MAIKTKKKKVTLQDFKPAQKFLNKMQKEQEEDEVPENAGAVGMCRKCKEWTEVGNSCCGDDYVHTF